MCFHPYHTQIINPHKTKALSNYQPACDWLHKSDEVDAARSYQRHRKEFEVLACSTLKAEFQACVLWGSEKGKEGSCVACSQMTCWQTSSTSNESIALVCQQLPPITPYPQKTWMCFRFFFFFLLREGWFHGECSRGNLDSPFADTTTKVDVLQRT